MKKLYLLNFFILFLFSCVTVSEKKFSAIQIENNESLLYVYRLARFANSGQQPLLRINGYEISRIVSGGYSAVKLKPGIYELTIHTYALFGGESKEPFYKVKFKISANEVQYFRWKSRLNGVYGGVYADTNNDYGFVEREIGQSEIVSTNYVESKQQGITLEPR